MQGLGGSLETGAQLLHSCFVGALADALVQRAAVERGEAPEPADARYRCAPTCCRSRG